MRIHISFSICRGASVCKWVPGPRGGFVTRRFPATGGVCSNSDTAQRGTLDLNQASDTPPGPGQRKDGPKGTGAILSPAEAHARVCRRTARSLVPSHDRFSVHRGLSCPSGDGKKTIVRIPCCLSLIAKRGTCVEPKFSGRTMPIPAPWRMPSKLDHMSRTYISPSSNSNELYSFSTSAHSASSSMAIKSVKVSPSSVFSSTRNMNPSSDSPSAATSTT